MSEKRAAAGIPSSVWLFLPRHGPTPLPKGAGTIQTYLESARRARLRSGFGPNCLARGKRCVVNRHRRQSEAVAEPLPTAESDAAERLEPIESDVAGDGRMGQPPDADAVDARFGDAAHGVEIHAAGRF